jgi:DNA-binding transcriptional LysR family regulator
MGQDSRVSVEVLLRGLSFDHLATFKAIVEGGSFRRAAEKRLISQAAVSQRIRQLEALLGIRLFDRRPGTSARLTSSGQLVAELADQVLADLEGFCTRARTLAVPSSEGPLTVASGPSFIKYYLLHATRHFGELYPDVEVRLQRSMTPDDVLHAVLEGAAQLGIYSGPVPTRNVRSFPLAHDLLRLVAPRGHPFAALPPSARLAELSRAPFALSWEGAHSRELTVGWARHHGVTLHVKIEADNLDTLKEAALQGVALTVLPEFAMREELDSGRLVSIEMPGLPLERPVSVIAAAGHPLSATEQAFIDVVVLHAREDQGSDDLGRATGSVGDMRGMTGDSHSV